MCAVFVKYLASYCFLIMKFIFTRYMGMVLGIRVEGMSFQKIPLEVINVCVGNVHNHFNGATLYPLIYWKLKSVIGTVYRLISS